LDPTKVEVVVVVLVTARLDLVMVVQVILEMVLEMLEMVATDE
jgi:hypothetical protein